MAVIISKCFIHPLPPCHRTFLSSLSVYYSRLSALDQELQESSREKPLVTIARLDKISTCLTTLFLCNLAFGCHWQLKFEDHTRTHNRAALSGT